MISSGGLLTDKKKKRRKLPIRSKTDPPPKEPWLLQLWALFEATVGKKSLTIMKLTVKSPVSI